MKYSQTITFQRKGRDVLSITPHRAGRYVGGSFWVLRRLQDESEVVVAPNYNHAKERHLEANELPTYAATADILITRPGGPGGRLGKLYSTSQRKNPTLQAQPWSRRESEFIDDVMSTLRRGGNVLVPVDASGRVLELLLLLSAHWKRQRLDAACKKLSTCNTLDYQISFCFNLNDSFCRNRSSSLGRTHGLEYGELCPISIGMDGCSVRSTI